MEEEHIFQMDNEEQEVGLVLSDKKKKKKTVLITNELIDNQEDEQEVGLVLGKKKKKDIEQMNNDDSLNIDEDYKYEDLLKRGIAFIKKLKEKENKLDKGKLQIKPPKISHIGSRKTIFINYLEIATILQRDPAHFAKYIVSDFGTTSDVDGEGHLILKDKFNLDLFHKVIREYIDEYVGCKNCSGMNTTLVKDKSAKLTLLNCADCLASRSVSKIKKAYVEKKVEKEEEY